MKTILVGGTHANTGDPWFRPGSFFYNEAFLNGIDISKGRGEGFIWSTQLEVWRFKKDMGTDAWQAAAHSLLSYIDAYCDGEANIIAHSHGGNVAAIAAAADAPWDFPRINHLITVGTPVRKSMDAVYKDANVNQWTHVYSDSDWWQLFGTFGTFNPWKHRRMKYADTNRLIAGKGHTELHSPELWTRLNMWAMV